MPFSDADPPPGPRARPRPPVTGTCPLMPCPGAGLVYVSVPTRREGGIELLQAGRLGAIMLA